MRALVAALVLIAACGSVTQDPPAATGGVSGDSSGGVGGGGRGGQLAGAGGQLGGAAGAAGDAGPLGPCTGLCDRPMVVGVPFNSGNLGTAASCYETTAPVAEIVCGNFTAPRTLSVNGQVMDCGGSGMPAPAAVNGGFCFVVSAGQQSFAYFQDL